MLTFPGISQAGTYTLTATSTLGNCSQEMNGTVLIQALNMPAAFNLTGGGTSCSGAPVGINLSNSQVGVLYQLRRGNTPVAAPSTELETLCPSPPNPSLVPIPSRHSRRVVAPKP